MGRFAPLCSGFYGGAPGISSTAKPPEPPSVGQRPTFAKKARACLSYIMRGGIIFRKHVKAILIHADTLLP